MITRTRRHLSIELDACKFPETSSAPVRGSTTSDGESVTARLAMNRTEGCQHAFFAVLAAACYAVLWCCGTAVPVL